MEESKYKLELTPPETKQIKYWNYYINKKAPDNISWGQGLHRYIDDIQAVQILWDISKIKEGTKDEKLSKEFLEYFCQINGFEADEIPDNDGALLKI